MAPASPPGGKKSVPAQIVHFPKRTKARRSPRRDGAKTDPDGRTFDEELVTEPEFFPPTVESGAVAKRSPSGDRPIWIDARDHHRSMPSSARGSRARGRSRKRGRVPSASEISEQSLKGHRLFELGQLDEAKEVFERLVETGTEDAYVHTMLGTICLALDEQDRALELFETALALSSSDIAARVYRGEIRLNRGKLNLALDDLQLAVRLGAVDDPFVERAKRLIEIARDVGSRKLR